MDHLITSIASDENKSIIFTLGTLTYGFWILLRNEWYLRKNTLPESNFIQDIIG